MLNDRELITRPYPHPYPYPHPHPHPWWYPYPRFNNARLILNSMEIQSFTHSNARVLWTLSWTGFRQIIPWFILTDFWCKHLFDLFWFKVQFYRSPSCRVALHAQLFETHLTLLSAIEINKLQLMQIIWNVVPYSHCTRSASLSTGNY